MNTKWYTLQKMNYEFTSKRLGFRLWEKEDLLPFSEMNSDTNVMEFYPNTLSRIESDAFVSRIQTMFQDYGYGLYAVDVLDTQKFIGYIGFWEVTFTAAFTPCIEIGWRIQKEKWNQGFATEGAKACLTYGFNHLQFTKVYSMTSKRNKKSERIMQKIGMKKIAEFEHPKVEQGHSLKPHVLYTIDRNMYPK